MNSTMRVVLGIGVVVVAVVLLVVLKDDGGDSSDGSTTTEPPRRAGVDRAAQAAIPTIVVEERQAGRRDRRDLDYNEGEQVRFKVDSDVSDEVHVHGYDIMKDVKAGGSVTLRLPGDDRRRLRGRARGPQGADPRAARQPVSLLQVLPLAHALVARQDLPIPAWLFAWGASIVLIVSFFALSAAWREPRFEERTLAPARRRALSRALLGLPGAGPLRRDRRLPARRRRLRGAARAPKRRTATSPSPSSSSPAGSASRCSASSSATSSGRSTRGGRSAGRSAAPSRRSPASAPPTSRYPGAAGPLAGGGRPGRLRLAGDRLRRQRRRRGRRLARTRPRVAALVYSGYTLAMMAVFGVEEWCERGEVFSVYFGMFSRLGCLGVSDGRLGVRRPLSAATQLGDGAGLGRRS